MAVVELHLNATYAQHPALRSVDEKSQSVMNSKLFSSCRTVLEPAYGLRDSETSDLNCSYEALIQKEALIVCHDRVFESFLCVLSLSSVLGKFIEMHYLGNDISSF